MSEIPCEHNDTALHMQSVRYGGKCLCTTCTSNGVVKEINRLAGISTAVIDDVNERVYLYGNILHENYHTPAEECQPYITIPTTTNSFRQLAWKTEVFVGEMSEDTIALAETPSKDWLVEVYLNGVNQVEGQEADYRIDGNKIIFNTPLKDTDRTKVVYRYEKAGQ